MRDMVMHRGNCFDAGLRSSEVLCAVHRFVGVFGEDGRIARQGRGTAFGCSLS